MPKACTQQGPVCAVQEQRVWVDKPSMALASVVDSERWRQFKAHLPLGAGPQLDYYELLAVPPRRANMWWWLRRMLMWTLPANGGLPSQRPGDCVPSWHLQALSHVGLSDAVR